MVKCDQEINVFKAIIFFLRLFWYLKKILRNIQNQGLKVKKIRGEIFKRREHARLLGLRKIAQNFSVAMHACFLGGWVNKIDRSHIFVSIERMNIVSIWIVISCQRKWA